MASIISNNISLPLLALAILTRWLVAQFPHSGYKSPPLYGDYEAQRHWMEITNNFPVQEWYTNSTDNDLLYWGLDYPPLTAYHMYSLGYVSKKLFNSTWIKLHDSRGLETYEHKIFMRATVIVSELLVYIPAIIYYFRKTQPILYSSPPSTMHKQNIVIYTTILLMYPAQILIDHGHFQYNCVFMGLVLWAIIFLIKNKLFISSILFTLALCYKQMSLYYALPFFWYIASVNFRTRPLSRGIVNIFITGLLVTCTFAVVFSPYLLNRKKILGVIQRIFPFNRGLFEDKVANFWFSLSIFYKYRNLYSINELLKASTALTLLCSLPAGLQLLFRPSIESFKYALVNTSLVFFLLSFQVHEKTILLPALPLLLLSREHPMASNWFIIISTFSLQPLLIKDGQTIPYFVLIGLYTLLYLQTFHKQIILSQKRILSVHNLIIVIHLSSILACFILSVATLLIEPPKRYPHIHPTINALFCCAHFIGFLLFFYYKQFSHESSKDLNRERIFLIKKTN